MNKWYAFDYNFIKHFREMQMQGTDVLVLVLVVVCGTTKKLSFKIGDSSKL
jgi:hypothetical protein